MLVVQNPSVCANITGTSKKKLLVIGISHKPRCFKNVKKKTFPWIISRQRVTDIFRAHLHEQDKGLFKKRKILLVVDNYLAHPRIVNLTNIKITFLLINATSVLQPKDIDVIKCFKSIYKRFVILHLLKLFQIALKKLTYSAK